MNDFPKLVIFTNEAIPRVKSMYKGASVALYSFNNLVIDDDNPITSLLNVSQNFEELFYKKATVISGYTEKHLTLFLLSNTSYPYLKVETEDDYIVLPAFEDALLSLHDRDDAISALEDSTSIIFSIFKYLEAQNLNRMIKKNDTLIDKAYDTSSLIHFMLEAFFFGWFKVKTPS